MTSRQNKARSKKKTTADAAVFVVMRRAQQCRPHAVCRRATVTRASRSKARLRLVTNRRDSWRSHVHRTYIAQRVQSFKLQTANVGDRGELPSRSLGGLRGPFSHVREWPPLPRPHTVWGQKQRCRAAPPAPYGRKKKQPSRAAFLPRPGRESCPNCQYGILIPISPLFSLDNMRY